jgi:signal transduction histidine kinase/DNA-binding response OmpR family regulator
MPLSFPNISLKGKKILVVDDDNVILNTIVIMLRNSGMVTVAATGGAEALEEIAKSVPDILLLDYMMPGMNGVEVYRRMQQDKTYEHCRDVPVIMLTAKTNNEEEQAELLKMGMSAYLLKPFGYKELVNIISNVLTLHTSKVENQRLHKQISEMKNYLQSVFDGITDLISVQDASFNIQNYNQATGVSFFQGHRSPLKSFENAADAGKCYQRYFKRESACPGCPALISLESQRSHTAEIRSDSRYFQVSTFPVRDASDHTGSFIEVIKDITDRKELEQRLIESVKLAGVGTLAAGVAHEINNPLSIILGFAQTMLKDLPLENELHNDLRIVEHEANRCAKVVKDLLTFARPGRMEKSETDLIELMQTSISLLRHFIRKNEIAVEEEYSPEIPKPWIDSKKMQQVFINVLLNSIEAMPHGGRLKIKIDVVHAEEMIRIDVSDTGSGIPEDNLMKIFEPFFTTKSNKGTGLGLSICRSIIKEHLGTIGVNSVKNQGTTVTLRLPLKNRDMKD